MGRKALTPVIPPTLAVAEAASSPNPGGAGAVIWSSTTSAFMVWNGSSWQSMQLQSRNTQSVLLGSDVTTTSGSLVDATGLSFSVKSGVKYRFHFWLLIQNSNTAAGVELSINGPSVNTNGLAYNVFLPTSASAMVTGFRRAVNTATDGTAVDVADANLLAEIFGIIDPSADGTLIVRFSTETATTTTARIKAGSYGELTALAATAPAAFENTPVGIDTVSGTTYTTVQGDQGRIKKCTNSGAVTVTVPPNSSVPYPIGATISFVQDGTGQVTLAPGSGVTLSNALTLKTRARYSMLTATKHDTDAWYVTGDMAAS